MDTAVTILYGIAIYLVYLAVKIGIFYRYDKKYRERAAELQAKSRHRQEQVRPTDSDQSSSPLS
ncbi:MAG: hypothetical protein GX058_03095 [Firmicutes bacterium]|nr:hypothetical protein [Bacillota bacterium]